MLSEYLLPPPKRLRVWVYKAHGSYEPNKSYTDAAVFLQRWFRSTRVQAWDMSSASIAPTARTKAHICLVEPSKTEFWFLANDLASAYIATVADRHPITRRTLLPAELLRIENKLFSPKWKLLFSTTRRYARETRAAIRNYESIHSALLNFAGEKLDAVLTGAELGDPDPAPFATIEDYEDCIYRIARFNPWSCNELLRVHRDQAHSREVRCDPMLWEIIYDSICSLLKRYCGHDDRPAATPAFVFWMREGVRTL